MTLEGNIVEDEDFPYRVVCDDCGATVGYARVVGWSAGVWAYQWRHTDPDHTCTEQPPRRSSNGTTG